MSLDSVLMLYLLSKCDDNEHPCFQLKGKPFRFSSWKVILATSSSYAACILLMKLLSVSTLVNAFIMKDVELCQMIFSKIEMIMWILVCSLLLWSIILTIFTYSHMVGTNLTSSCYKHCHMLVRLAY